MEKTTYHSSYEPYGVVLSEAGDRSLPVVAGKLRHRKLMRRRKHDLLARTAAIRRLLALGLKAKK
jgi:hypothetical protein